MKAVIQRVSWGSVSAEEEMISQIGPGLLVFLAIGEEDQETDLDWMVDKVYHLRCFEDEGGKMNRSLKETGRELLCVSQFTLYGDCRRGRRPSFDKAAAPPLAICLFEKFVDKMKEKGVNIRVGKFGARMRVALENEGPVTLILDSKA